MNTNAKMFEWPNAKIIGAEAVHPWTHTASTMLRGARDPATPRDPAPPRCPPYQYSIIYPHGCFGLFFRFQPIIIVKVLRNHIP